MGNYMRVHPGVSVLDLVSGTYGEYNGKNCLARKCQGALETQEKLLWGSPKRS